jgi:hypothetical protein
VRDVFVDCSSSVHADRRCRSVVRRIIIVEASPIVSGFAKTLRQVGDAFVVASHTARPVACCKAASLCGSIMKPLLNGNP